jgi:hypothetical protein
VNEEVDVRDGDDIIAVASPYAECKDKEASITFGLARVFCTGENLPPPYVLTGFDTKFGDTGLCFCFFEYAAFKLFPFIFRFFFIKVLSPVLDAFFLLLLSRTT